MQNQNPKEFNKDLKWKNITPAHEKLWIWQKSSRLNLEICEICKTLPRHEMYNLRPQIERSSKSIKDNIAEANESYYFNDKRKGLFIARKEAAETQNHLREMEHKNYLPQLKSQEMIDEYEEIKRGINGLLRTILEKKENSNQKGSKKL